GGLGADVDELLNNLGHTVDELLAGRDEVPALPKEVTDLLNGLGKRQGGLGADVDELLNNLGHTVDELLAGRDEVPALPKEVTDLLNGLGKRQGGLGADVDELLNNLGYTVDELLSGRGAAPASLPVILIDVKAKLEVVLAQVGKSMITSVMAESHSDHPPFNRVPRGRQGQC
ncbi:hypothetical protein H0H87_004864, partial [Tephrocybe sp. NHM501043]